MKYLYWQHPHEQEVEIILKELFKKFYGPAGKYIAKFILLGEAIFWDSKLHYKTINKYCVDGTLNVEPKQIYCPSEKLPAFTRIIAKAYSAAQEREEKEPYLTRLKLFDEAVYQMIKAHAKD